MTQVVEHDLRWEVGPLSPALQKSEVHIWLIHLPVAKAREDKFVKCLSQNERHRMERFHFQGDKTRSLVSRGGLRHIIERYINVPAKEVLFDFTEFGKPFLNSHNVFFNVSHSFDCILFAITQDCEIGIDVEKFNHDLDFLALAAHCFSEKEYKKIISISPQERVLTFYRFWTRKEAILKAMGRGLHYPLNKVEVDFSQGGERDPLRSSGIISALGEQWELNEFFPLEGYIASIATQRKYNIIVPFKGNFEF